MDLSCAFEILTANCKSKRKSLKKLSELLNPKKINPQLVEPEFTHLSGDKKREKINSFLKHNGIKVYSGIKSEKLSTEPIALFSQLIERFKFSQKFIESFTEHFEFYLPTPIQMIIIPSMLERKDIYATAPTGSGKTIAYLLPIFRHILLSKTKSKQKNSICGPTVIILVPTRELAIQISSVGQELSKLIEKPQINMLCLTSLADVLKLKYEAKEKGSKYSKINCDCLVSTPGRLAWSINRKNSLVELSSLEWLIMDESDKLFGVNKFKRKKVSSKKNIQDESNEKMEIDDDDDNEIQEEHDEKEESIIDERGSNQVMKINGFDLAQNRMKRQVFTILDLLCDMRNEEPETTKIRFALFSATSHSLVKKWASKNFFKNSCAFIKVGIPDTALDSVDQRLKYCADDNGKLMEISRLLNNQSDCLKPNNFPVLIMVSTKQRAIFLYAFLKTKVNLSDQVDYITSERTEKEREDVVKRLRDGSIPILVSTELMARGMDFPNLGTVINYDLPSSSKEYIHSIGRTGRGMRLNNKLNELRKAHGLAITLWTNADKNQALMASRRNQSVLLSILQILKISNMPFNNELLSYLSSNIKKN